jgi:hypothetical protein
MKKISTAIEENDNDNGRCWFFLRRKTMKLGVYVFHSPTTAVERHASAVIAPP